MSSPLPKPSPPAVLKTSASSPPTLSRETPGTTNYAFLVHSQETLPHNLPPTVDNKPLARQRRRRTSPEDQAILEAEFKRNPKPDKAARQRLVERVALGDKEVQIWFQNRRQTSRRKSKPLEPHELLASDPASSSGMVPGSDHSYGSNNDLVLLSSSPRLASDATPILSDNVLKQDDITSSQVAPTQAEILQDPSFSYGLQTPAAQGKIIPSQESVDFVSTQPASSARSGDAGEVDDSEQQTDSLLPSASSSSRTLKRSVSTVRLSLASDYMAKISQPDEDSPSPPNANRTVDMLADKPARTSLHRSYSAASINDTLSSSTGSKGANKRGISGRSRDSRAWEFWCDRDSRTDLMKKAEQETRGSAADAISLIRSSSKRTALAPLSAGQGGLEDNPSERRTFKRVKSVHNQSPEDSRKGRPKLARSQTSIGRLESQSKKRDSGIGMTIYDDESTEHDKMPKKRPQAFASPSGDSDKENHDPDDEHALLPVSFSHRRTGPKQGRERAGLGISYTAPLSSSRRFGTAVNSGNQAFGRRRMRLDKGGFEASPADGENADPEDDAEIAAFMQRRTSSSSSTDPSGARHLRRAATTTTPGEWGRSHGSNEDDDNADMDCVQGLLRLSQGAWR